MIESRTLILDRIDLDHILGEVAELIRNNETPPSLVFLEELINEVEFNGLSLDDIDYVKIILE